MKTNQPPEPTTAALYEEAAGKHETEIQPNQAPIGTVDETQINIWRTRYRRIIAVIIKDYDERHIGYFHRPDMETLAATNKMRKTDEIKAVDTLFANCWLGGSPLIQQDAIVKMAAAAKFNAALNVQQAELKNL